MPGPLWVDHVIYEFDARGNTKGTVSITRYLPRNFSASGVPSPFDLQERVEAAARAGFTLVLFSDPIASRYLRAAPG